jgi:DNA-binding GntR family transcriptional regulator
MQRLSEGKRARTSRGAHVEEGPYQRLRQSIASGALLPNERLVESELADSFGVARAAVRTAIVRLAQENLVERLPNRGARVRRISEKEAVELLEARLVLECLAAERAATNATPGDIATLRTILNDMEGAIEGDPLIYTETNAQLHNAIVRIADHTTVARLLEGLRARNTVFQMRSVLMPIDPRERLLEHRAIVDAIEAKSPKDAAEAMRKHLSDVAAVLRARLKQ